MTQRSFPWTAIGGDRTAPVELSAAVHAAQFPTAVLSGLTATRSGSNVVVAPGVAHVEGRFYHSDANETLTPTASVRSTVVLRLDTSTRVIQLVSKAGTSGAYPTLTQTTSIYEVPICNVDATVSPIAVTDARVLYRQPGVVNDTGRITFSAANWTAYVQRVGSIVQLRVDRSASTAAGASQTWETGIPADLLPTQTVVMAARGGGGTAASANISVGGLVTFTNNDTSPTATASMYATYFVS